VGKNKTIKNLLLHQFFFDTNPKVGDSFLHVSGQNQFLLESVGSDQEYKIQKLLLLNLAE
jgi:hypothetical protein